MASPLSECPRTSKILYFRTPFKRSPEHGGKKKAEVPIRFYEGSLICNTLFPAPRRQTRAIRAAAAGTAPSRETDPNKRVVITGMGLCSVFGNDPDTFYEKLLAGTSGIGEIDRFDASKFPTRFAGQIKNFDVEGEIDGKNARRLDDCLKYGLVAGKKALRMAGLEGDGLKDVSFRIWSHLCLVKLMVLECTDWRIHIISDAAQAWWAGGRRSKGCECLRLL